MKSWKITIFAALLAAVFGPLFFVDQAAAQFVAAPGATQVPRGPMALVIDPHTQVIIQFSVLDSDPGAYEKLTSSADHAPSADQVYAALKKAGASVALSPTVTTTAGVRAAMSVSTAIPYQAQVDGQTKTLSVNVGTTVDVTPEVTQDGTVALSISYTRIDAANDAKPNTAPATNTVSFTAWRELRPAESALLGVIKPIAGFGTQKDEVVFVRVLAVKHM